MGIQACRSCVFPVVSFYFVETPSGFVVRVSIVVGLDDTIMGNMLLHEDVTKTEHKAEDRQQRTQNE